MDETTRQCLARISESGTFTTRAFVLHREENRACRLVSRKQGGAQIRSGANGAVAQIRRAQIRSGANGGVAQIRRAQIRCGANKEGRYMRSGANKEWRKQGVTQIGYDVKLRAPGTQVGCLGRAPAILGFAEAQIRSGANKESRK